MWNWRASVNTRECFINLYLSLQFKYMIFHIFICILHLLWVYYELTKWPAPRWMLTWMVIWPEVNLFWRRPHCICCVNQLVIMLTRFIYMTVAERSVSKQGHLQPQCHSKARSKGLFCQAWNTIVSDEVIMWYCG